MEKKTSIESSQMAVDRLLSAADMLMAARERGAGSEAFVDAWLGRVDAGVPGVTRPFTYNELVEGMCFLIRCGFVDPAASADGRNSSSRRAGCGERMSGHSPDFPQST